MTNQHSYQFVETGRILTVWYILNRLRVTTVQPGLVTRGWYPFLVEGIDQPEDANWECTSQQNVYKVDALQLFSIYDLVYEISA